MWAAERAATGQVIAEAKNGVANPCTHKPTIFIFLRPFVAIFHFEELLCEVAVKVLIVKEGENYSARKSYDLCEATNV